MSYTLHVTRYKILPLFAYTAKNLKGKTQTGQLEAANEHELAAFLRNRKLVLISVKTNEPGKKNRFQEQLSFLWQRINGLISRVSLVEKMVFSRHLAVMIEAGFALNQGLKTLAEQTKNPRFKKIITGLENDIRQGKSFSESLAKYPTVFNGLYINMVKVGETGGSFGRVLRTLAQQMKKEHELTSRVRGAMIYPAIIMLVMVGIGILMMIMVVPKLTEVFEELEAKLPWTTRLIISLSYFLTEHSLLALAGLIALVILAKLALQNRVIKSVIHRLYLNLPILGSLIQKINSARFARTLSSLIGSGVAIVNSLKITANTLGNVHFKKSLLSSAQRIEKGESLGKTLDGYKNLYAPMVIQMIKVGEETGQLAEILKDLAGFYEEEVDNTTKNLSSVVEPILMVLIGIAVGFFAISMIQPIYSMMTAI